MQLEDALFEFKYSQLDPDCWYLFAKIAIAPLVKI
jgi:hypothetical protein